MFLIHAKKSSRGLLIQAVGIIGIVSTFLNSSLMVVYHEGGAIVVRYLISFTAVGYLLGFYSRVLVFKGNSKIEREVTPKVFASPNGIKIL